MMRIFRGLVSVLFSAWILASTAFANDAKVEDTGFWLNSTMPIKHMMVVTDKEISSECGTVAYIHVEDELQIKMAIAAKLANRNISILVRPVGSGEHMLFVPHSLVKCRIVALWLR